MKLTKKLEAEILKAYNEYWDAYLKGDMRTMSYWMHDNIQMIGSGRSEFFDNKKKTIKYYKSTADQVAGKADMRNRKITVLPVGDEILVNEECDFFVLIDSVWTFYGEGRISTLFTKTNKGWKIIQEHGSMPDARTAGGEQVNTDKIKAENVSLKDAIKRRTVELEEKNHELEIETALEKVRAVAMGMHKPDDLLNVCETMYNQLLSLGFTEMRNAMINIYNDAEKFFINYDYSDASGKSKARLSYSVLPFVRKIISTTKTAKDAFSETRLIGKTLTNLKELRKETGQKNDPRLNRSKVVYDYFYSIGIGSIGISTFEKINKEKIALLKRFRNVFELAYQRFIDIEKAEAQAKEARIETALERVRARTMAMQKSDELPQTTFLLFQQLKELGKTAAQVSIGIVNEEKGFVELSATVHGNAMLQTYHIPADEPFMMKKAVKAWKEKKRSLIIKIEGKRLKEYNSWRNSVLKKKIVFPEKQWIVNLVFFSKGMLSFSSDKEVSKETLQLLERFANVFDGTYTRFLDLQKAEAQTREAKIEAALEKVRARGMAMQTSEELGALIGTLFTELTKLDMALTRCVTWIIDPKTKDAVWWMANSEDPSHPMNYFIPYHEQPPFLAFIKEWKKRTIKWVYDLKGQTKKNWDDHLFSKTGLAKMPKFIRDGMKAPRRVLLSATFSNFGGMNVASLEPLSEEHYNILLRFAKVFDLTYTRFNDLKKAEAQAREAEIELALERVRAKTMAMQKSDELKETTLVLFQQFKALGATTAQVSICIFDEEAKMGEMFVTLKGEKIDRSFPMEIGKESFVMKKAKKVFLSKQKNFSITIKGKELQNYNRWRNSLIGKKGWDESDTVRKQAWYVDAVFFSRGMMGISSDTQPSTETIKLLERFANVFDATYTRFNDLKKAEAQAREAHIEASLERVRAKTMAMHKSSDMLEVVKTLGEQFELLDFKFNSVNFNTDTHEKDWNLWLYNVGSAMYPGKIHVPYIDHPCFNRPIEAFKKGGDLHSFIFTKEEKDSFFDHIYTNTVAKYGSEERKRFTYSALGFAMSTAVTKNTRITIANFKGEPFSEDENAILRRFANVFEQSYTRFLDLQKAEAQAREAQIEASLERVRSRSLAMHSSDELVDASDVLFQELKKMGIETIRVGIGIIDDEKETVEIWSRSEINDKIENKILGVVSAGVHQVFDRMIKAHKENKPWFSISREGNEVKEYYNKLSSHLSYPLRKEFNKKETIASFFFPEGSLNVVSHEPLKEEECQIMVRFAKVFGQMYKRFLDLQKAEAQARESQIQLALERVRARTMAMQRSDELMDAASLLFKQIEDLGTKSWSSGFIIFQPDELSINSWMSKPDGSMGVPFNIPVTEDPFFIKIYEAYKRGEEFFVMESSGKELGETYKYMFSLPGAAKALGAIEDLGFQMPTFQITHCAFFPQGFLMFITYEACPEMWDIFKRFGKVFEQTYTRFLDLQKAEAQAKEAKIEAALERVRSRTMGMQKSEELKEVIQVVYEQFVHLNIHIEHTGFIIDYKAREDMHIWLADQHLVPSEVTIPFFDSPPNNSIKEAKEKGQNFFKYLLTFEEKNKFYRDLFKFVPGVPEESLEYYFNCPGLAGSGVLLENIGLYIENFSGTSYSDEENNVLMRFGKVFQQTYTRFLDLQKAEAQARESQIELGLERVRARAMAMQKSDELKELIGTVYNELTKLDLALDRCLIWVMNSEDFSSRLWMANVESQPVNFYVPHHNNPPYLAFVKAWKDRNKRWQYDLHGQVKKEWDEFVFNQTEMKHLPDPVKKNMQAADRIMLAASFHNFGCLQTAGPEPLKEEQFDILNRFAKVFDLTYTRFNDLQKAEEQARESQIELGLERVRARAMAMQKSNELSELVDTVFKELTKLDFALTWCIINIIDEPSLSNTVWAANPDINMPPESYHMLFEDYPFHHAMMKGWKERKTKYVYTLEGQEKKIYDEYLFNETEFRKVPAEAQAASRAMEKYVVTFSFSNFGGLQTVGDAPLSDANLDILSRFGKVFDLTYTRFNDLKQAEAQAREAKIEAALEKVRSRTMAMQRSDELSETAAVLFQEFKKLGEEDLLQITIGIYNEAEGLIEFRVTSWAGGGEQINRPFILSIEEPTLLKPVFTAWKKQKKSIVVDLKGQQLEDWLKYRNANSGVTVRSEDTAGRRVVTVAFFSKGHISFSSSEPKPPETIQLLERFAGVFDLTYTRFLDLKNAEAQARESQIQLALERVRARTMAMQRSEELSETAAVLFEQLKNVGEKPERAFIGVVNEEEHVIEVWATHHGGTQLNMTVKASIDEPMVMNRMYVGWKAGKKSLVIDLKGDELESYFQYLKGIGAPVSREIFGERRFENIAFFSKGMLGVITPDPQTEESIQLYERFAGVFDLTYTRFLDLQKAEAQAREAKIEVSLERIRARAMAMHKTNELFDAADVVNRELSSLGVPSMNISYAFIDKEEKSASYYGPNPVDGKISPVPFSFPHTETDVMRSLLSSWKKQEPFGIIELDEDATIKHQTWVGGYIQYWMEKNKIDTRFSVEEFLAVSPKTAVIYSFNFRYGYLFIIGEERLSTEQEQMLPRFTKVFELAYRRFLDLNQAEAQAREAQIEASLERVRSKTMAMHSSNDVGDTVATMFDEFVKLDIHTNRCGILIFSDEPAGEVWTAKSNPEGKANLIIGKLDLTVHALLHGIYKAWKKKESFYMYSMEGDDLRKYYQALNELENYPVKFDMNALPSKEFHSDFYFPEGSVFTFTAEPLPDEASRVIKRFAAVFGQTYRRYLDLQKAEAQAREATIEAGLERVRARTMAMHSSDDVSIATATMFDELKKLGIQNQRGGITVIRPDQTQEVWSITNLPDGNVLRSIGVFDMRLHPLWQRLFKAKENKEDYQYYRLEGKDKENYIDILNATPNYLAQPIKEFPDVHVQSYFFGEGGIWTNSLEPHTEEHKQVMKRFASVFSLTFRRYQDLKKAEAQTREATIEAALEKVRGKAMAMHNSNDLSVTASMIITELRKLGINPIRCGVGILNKETNKAQLYTATSSADGDSLSVVGWVMLKGHPVLEEIYQKWLDGQDYFPELSGDSMKAYYHQLLAGLSVPLPDFKDTQKHYGHFFSFSVGCLYAWAEKKYNDDEIKILKRFATIIDLTFRRYFELQKSEANAREAVKQAALDRIRADIASMRSVTDLNRITPLIWNELTILDIPFIRCGVFIMDDSQQLIHTFLSTPEGKAIAAFHIPYNIPGNVSQILSHWQKKEKYLDHWDEEAFTEFAHTMVKQGALASPEQYLKTLPKGGFYLHFLPFLQGMLYVGNTSQLGEEEIILIQHVADAFSTAYARYEDFNKLEAAKQQVDKTLVDLRQTQQQLVQSEKMASLGELTAGIAHEIQNPLNFVNNFSEVSNELIDEMNAEIEKGDMNEAKAIADDIKQNLEKINHHGKRADAIVKSMLQHSRSSSGKKEPTDINALADEYLRLSYHGLRAKDKSFNAKFEMDLDKTIDKVNIISQDVGRVILNLINNAFYAVSEKQKLNIPGYEPTVTVTTKNLGNKVEIRVIDNGNGIPQKVLDKIFQPFFTTKPTGQGTGLGLSLSYDIITKGHGGDLRVETKEGEGSEFIIQLPKI